MPLNIHPLNSSCQYTPSHCTPNTPSQYTPSHRNLLNISCQCTPTCCTSSQCTLTVHSVPSPFLTTVSSLSLHYSLSLLSLVSLSLSHFSLLFTSLSLSHLVLSLLPPPSSIPTLSHSLCITSIESVLSSGQRGGTMGGRPSWSTASTGTTPSTHRQHPHIHPHTDTHI